MNILKIFRVILCQFLACNKSTHGNDWYYITSYTQINGYFEEEIA